MMSTGDDNSSGQQLPSSSPCSSPVSGMNPSPRRAPTTFYRRPLPNQTCIAFDSLEGRSLFKEALAAGGMEAFFSLIQHFHTQADPAFCGPGSLTMVLNALQIDPGRTWKGVWRWFDETLLDCCEPLDIIQEKGISLDKAHCLARCNGAKSHRRYGDAVSLEQFRADVQRVTMEGEGKGADENEEGPCFMLCSYSRKTLGQTGDGHFSPIGGFHKEKDLVLILDVARFKYPPHWVPLPLLWEAFQATDPASGKARGYLLLSRNRWSKALMFVVDHDRYPEWPALREWLLALHQEEAQTLMRPTTTTTIEQDPHKRRRLCLTQKAFQAFVATIPTSLASLITAYPHLKCTSKHAPENSLPADQDAFLLPMVKTIEAHPCFGLLPLPQPSTEPSCCPVLPLDERHALVVLWLALVAWAAVKKKEDKGEELQVGWQVVDEGLKREVTQLKVRLQALAVELPRSSFKMMKEEDKQEGAGHEK